MKNIVVIATILGALVFTQAYAYVSEGYKFITPEELNSRIKAGDSSFIVLDVCPPEQFSKGHIPGAIETNASPVKTTEETARLEIAIPKLVGDKDIVVVCPGGSGGAKRTIDYYTSKGIDAKRLMVLEKGMNKWPYETSQVVR